jgi:PIN domain nuclease of toxin-antitoxin system
MTDDVPIYVLDSFSILAFFQAEPGAPRVRALLESGRLGEAKLFMAVVNLGEVIYKTIKEFGNERA